MIKLKYINKEKNIKAIIEEDPAIGFYLYVWELDSNKEITDTLQDSLEISKKEAEEGFGIPNGQWELIVKKP